MSASFRDLPMHEIWSRVVARGFGWRSLSLILAGFIALLVTNGVSIWSAEASNRQTQAVLHTRDVRRTLDQTESHIVEAVNAQRGYLLTGETDFETNWAEARAAVIENFQALRELVRDNPSQLRRLDEVWPLVQEGLALTEQIIRDAREGRFTQAVAVVRSGRSAELLEMIQGRLDEIDTVERGLLAERRQAADVARQANLWFSTLGTVLVVVVAGLAIFQFSVNFQTIVRAREELDEANRDLEKRVEDRTLALSTAHAEVARARDRAEAMLREVNHRVGNSLQLVSSFITLQGRSVTDEAARDAFRATQARIEAVSRVHRQLYTSSDMTRVQLDEYLTSLVDELRQSLCSGDRACIVTVQAEKLTTTTDRTVAVGVLVAELVTNAVKYAYPDGRGEIRVRLVGEPVEKARLTVEDDGIGVDDGQATPKGTGLGKTIIAAMARDLRSEVAYVYGPAGLSASLIFDL